MCGIAGMLSAPGSANATPQTLRAMAAMIRHRGPDGFGFYVDDRCGLAHARLSILDLAGGAQPMASDDGTVWMTFNGEVFNYLELRDELAARGHTFRTRSDTEVIIHAYQEWGEAAWAKFNGQFAIGIWDTTKRQLWLARDRVGIAPLFYTKTDRGLAFASEAKAIFASGLLPATLDAAGLACVFTLWAAPGPGTVFEGVRIVEPGTAVCFDERLGERMVRYWQARFAPDPSIKSLDDAADGLASRLERATELRFRADVPVGTYVSGGLDSSVVANIARRITGDSLQSFSLRFEDPAYDETEPQRRMVASLGTRHHEIVVGPREIAGAIQDVAWHAETPLLRTGPAPMFLLSGLVRQHGMKVVLTGEGADEMLAGYDVFKEAKVRRFWARQPGSAARAALLARVHPYVRGGTQATGMWQEFFRQGLTETDDPLYSHRPRWRNTAWTTRFLAESVRRCAEASAIDGAVSAVMPECNGTWSPLARAQAIELTTFMSPYLLSSQGDRMIMGHAVEGRYPYLDPDVMDFCMSLPDGLRMRGLREKAALRRLAERTLPKEVAARRKWPYRAPIAGALFGADAPEFVRELLSPAGLAASPVIDAKPAGAIVSRLVGADAGRIGEREEMALIGLLTVRMIETMFVDGGGFAARASDCLRRIDGQTPDVMVDRRTAGVRE